MMYEEPNWGMGNIKRHKDCPFRTKLANCDAVGGFCTSVNKTICEGIHKALNMSVKALEQEPCEDAVSREAVLDKAYAYGNGLEPEGYCVNVEDVQALPPVTPTRKKGKWINREHCQVDEDAYEVATCSNCKAEITLEYPYDSFCPNCGKRME